MVEPFCDLDEFEPFYDFFEVRQNYERSATDENIVTLTTEIKYGDSKDFEKSQVKVIKIGPDPPLCLKRYIWGRKSKSVSCLNYVECTYIYQGSWFMYGTNCI